MPGKAIMNDVSVLRHDIKRIPAAHKPKDPRIGKWLLNG